MLMAGRISSSRRIFTRNMHLADRMRRELSDWRTWVARAVILSAAALAGLTVVGFTWLTDHRPAGVMHAAGRWLPKGSAITAHGLLVAGGAAGIAAAFNTPLAGVMFAIEELSRTPEQRRSGLLIAGILLAGLMAVSISGDGTYFGVIRVPDIGQSLFVPALVVAVTSGVVGGIFVRLLIASLGGRSDDAPSRWRAGHLAIFAAACGLGVALIGLVTHGATFGSGYSFTRSMLESGDKAPALYLLIKFLATWLTAWSGVPGGIFAPALAIGAALGNDIAMMTSYPYAPTLMALGMAGFLAAATQAPLTAFIIVMEMVDGHAMVLSLMACALVSSGISRVLSRPLYPTLAQMQLERISTSKEAVPNEKTCKAATNKGAPKGSTWPTRKSGRYMLGHSMGIE